MNQLAVGSTGPAKKDVKVEQRCQACPDASSGPVQPATAAEDKPASPILGRAQQALLDPSKQISQWPTNAAGSDESCGGRVCDNQECRTDSHGHPLQEAVKVGPA